MIRERVRAQPGLHAMSSFKMGTRLLFAPHHGHAKSQFRGLSSEKRDPEFATADGGRGTIFFAGEMHFCVGVLASGGRFCQETCECALCRACC
jgi:hypothetical protein